MTDHNFISYIITRRESSRAHYNIFLINYLLPNRSWFYVCHRNPLSEKIKKYHRKEKIGGEGKAEICP